MMQKLRLNCLKFLIILGVIIINITVISSSFALDFIPTDQRSIDIKEGDRDISLNFHANRDTVFSIDKTGGINLGDKSSFYGTIWLVPSYKDDSDEWFLCPLINLNNARPQIENLFVAMDNPDETVTCYQYSDTSKTKTIHAIILNTYSVGYNGKIKIASQMKFIDILPKDTGFAFLFISIDQTRFASAKSTTESLAKSGQPTESAVTVDMSHIEKNLIIAKEVAFISETGKEVGEKFDWTDMIDFGYKFSEVISLNGKTGLLLGTYGYGTSDTISIDPLYTVDYSPIPAQWLQNGNVTASLDSQFGNIIDITVGISDNSTGTTYDTFVSSPASSPNSTGLISANSSTGGWATEQNAYADGGSAATAGAGDISQWWGYNFGIPTAATITDITVRLDLWKNLVGNTHYIQCVNLSWDGGTTYSSCQNLSSPTTTEASYNLSGLWGRTWTATELNNNLRVQVASSTGTTGVLNLDWIPVTVTYTYPSANYSNGTAISGKWSVTYNPAYQYFLRVYKTSSGSDTIYVYAYNSTNTLNTQSTNSAISGAGWFNINVTSLMQYMTSTVGLNFSAFRFYTNTTQSFSEERLRAETNDTTPPTINSCSTNTSTIGCGGSATLRCNITDNIDVSTATFQINSSNYTTTKNGDNFSTSFSPIGGTSSGGILYDWQYAYATDIMGNIASFDPNIQINYTCCSPNWVAQYDACLTNDTQLKYYTDSNTCGSSSGLPVDNGTYVYCNYCSEDLQKHYDYGECNLSGQRAFNWHDHNLFSCCLITSLVSDCSILYSPYNATDYENCTATYHDFSLDLDTDLTFGWGFGGIASDKVFGKIWLNDTNTSYTCISYVKTTDGQIVQTNPPYTKRTESTITLTQKEIEDREFFIPQQGLANIYWTNHNLVMDGRQYVFGVECSGNGQRIISEKISTVGYKPVNEPITRWFWAKQNMTGIILFIIMLIIFIFLISWALWRVKQG